MMSYRKYQMTSNAVGVLYDATGGGNSATATTGTSWSHTGTPSADVIVWVHFANQAANSTISATYDGNAMTQRGSTLFYASAASFFWWLACFSYPTVGSGAKTIAVSTAATTYCKANSVSYLNVGSYGTPATNNGASGTSLTVSSVASAGGRRVSNVLVAPFATGALSAYNQTSRWNIVTGTWAPVPLVIGDAPGAGSVSFSATADSSNIWGGMALDLLPA